MTILFLSRLFYPHIGGVERHVLEVGKRLVKMGNKVIVITEKYQSEGESAKVTGEVGGIEIIRISIKRDSGVAPLSGSPQNDGGERGVKENWFKKFQIWWWLWNHRDIIKKADIIHCHDVFFWYLPFRFLYPKKKVYTTFHGYETKFPPSKKAILIRKTSQKLSWGNICVGEYLKKWYGTKPDYITYGGVDVHLGGAEVAASPGARRYLASSPSEVLKGQAELRILFIGRLEEDNGALVYLKALRLMRQKKIEIEFEACGEGSLRSEVEQYGKVYGFVKDLSQYLQKADIVFVSSYLSILESMKHRKLVFSVYDNPLKEDYLKMSPFSKWIIIESSPKKLAGKMKYFIQHEEEREKLVNKSYEWVRKQTWEKVLGIYIDLWNLKIPDRQ